MNQYTPILILFSLVLVLAGAVVTISALLGRRRDSDTLLSPYECGVDRANAPHRPVSIRFFIIGLAFLLFDVELGLLYPWAILFRKFVSEGRSQFILLEGLVFIGILSAGLIYLYKSKTLRWE